MFRWLHFVCFLLSVVSVGTSSIIEECIRSSGVDYRGEQQITSKGNRCLNWSNTTRDYDVTSFTDSETGVGDHRHCRNPDGSGQPWCYVTGPDGGAQREACAIESCRGDLWKKTELIPLPDQGSEVPTEVELAPSTAAPSSETEIFEPANSLPVQVEGAAVQPVIGVSQRIRTGPKKKKDLGVLGYTLGILMMAIIILLGVGITVGYFYKRGRDLKRQHEQRVYEREMHRITLPLSAFANPTCEVVDENTIVISAEQTPVLEACEGEDPLMAQAGTPGA